MGVSKEVGWFKNNSMVGLLDAKLYIFFFGCFFFQKSVTFFFVFEAAVVLDLFYSFQKGAFLRQAIYIYIYS